MRRGLLFASLIILLILFVAIIAKRGEKAVNKEEVDSAPPSVASQKRINISDEERERVKRLGLMVKNLRNIPFNIQRERREETGEENYGTLIGTILDKDRRPLKGCLIVLKASGSPFSGARKTDLSGKFSFERIEAGEYRIMFRCEEGTGERRDIIVEKDKINSIEIVLENSEMRKSSTVSGNIIDFITHNPIEGAKVTFKGSDGSASLARTDNLGRFTIELTLPQKGRIEIEKEGYISKGFDLEIKDREVVINNISLVKGDISDDGKRYKGIGAALIEKDGEFVVTHIFDGSPAQKAGLLKGDRIYQVNGMDVSSLNLNELIALIRGDERTNVILTIRRGDETKNIQIVRETIEIK